MKALLDSFNFDLPSLNRSAGQVYCCDCKCCAVIKCSSSTLRCMLFVFFTLDEKPFIKVKYKQASVYVHFEHQNPQEPCCNASVNEKKLLMWAEKQTTESENKLVSFIFKVGYFIMLKI